MCGPVPDRFLIARRSSDFVPFRWTEDVPDDAVEIGCRRESGELVSCDIESLRIAATALDDDFLNDNDQPFCGPLLGEGYSPGGGASGSLWKLASTRSNSGASRSKSVSGTAWNRTMFILRPWNRK